LIRGAKTAVVGQHPFSHFVSTDTNELKLAEIEVQMLKDIQPSAANNYGIDVKFLGVKKLGLPESVTEKVFDRMTAERKAEADTLRARGEAEANRIRSEADRERQTILAQAENKATVIRGQADAEAAKSFMVFEQNPDLANLMQGLRALEAVTKDRTTLFLDGRTRPFDLMTRPLTNLWPSISTNQFRNAITSSSSTAVEDKTSVSQNVP
jgi:membrane protease subunit HflC